VIPLLLACAPRGKSFSAMVRARNEEEYLERSILSIIDHVEEVVLIDNLSTDSTPAIMANLAARYPQKVRVMAYCHKVARPGPEHIAELRRPAGRRSPSLLPNYYNYCLRMCSKSFVIKWDADMIAMDEFSEVLAAFRKSNKLIMQFNGVNVSRDGAHCIEGEPYEPHEPRVFPTRFAKYVAGPRYENLRTPFLTFPEHLELRYDSPTYIHMKYARKAVFANRSPEDVQRTLSQAPGPPLPTGALECVRRWRLCSYDQA